MTDDLRPESETPGDHPEMAGPEQDSIEAEEATEAAAEDTLDQAEGEVSVLNSDADESDVGQKSGPPSKLERLQKILAQAGIASRRHAEELITQGRVQVNGKVVTELGTKADATRDHIRVDGKLLQGAERLRYFVLNKPKGFVTTVSDPQGRPTVMQFFEKMRERLYPVGRLDYLSEGLLLVTNDGELANKLTRAASGVEKTYLVKVSGQPSEENLDRLREGVAIDHGRPGSGQVHTAPAQIRQVRQGDNPWYEVVLIEGRNRELRKMFEEIGHFVEKIRRVGYGPLVLDLEPGKMRELDAEEVEDLQKAADGRFRPKKPRETRRAKRMEPRLPAAGPKRGRSERGGRGFERGASGGPREFRPKERFAGERQDRPARGEREGSRSGWKKDARGDRRPAQFGSGQRRRFEREDRGDSEPRRAPTDRGGRPFGTGAHGRTGKSFDGGERRGFRGSAGEERLLKPGNEDRVRQGRPAAGRAGFSRSGAGQSRSDHPRAGSQPPERQRFGRPGANRSEGQKRGGPPGRAWKSASRPAGKGGVWKPRTDFEESARSGERPRRGSDDRPGSGKSGPFKSRGYRAGPGGGTGRGGSQRARGEARSSGPQHGRPKHGGGRGGKREGGPGRKGRE